MLAKLFIICSIKLFVAGFLLHIFRLLHNASRSSSEKFFYGKQNYNLKEKEEFFYQNRSWKALLLHMLALQFKGIYVTRVKNRWKGHALCAL